MSKYIPVEPEKWAEMVKAMAEVKQLKEHIRYLEIELTTETARWERAMEEVERLRASSFVTAVPVEEYEKLKAENERLRKAGDAMADVVAEIPMQRDDSMLVALKVMDWNAAKDGKPTE
jgi:hypothetical protein